MGNYSTLLLILFIVMLILLLCSTVSRYRYYRLRCEKDEQQNELIRLKLEKQEELLRGLIASRKEMYQHNATLRRQLKEIDWRPKEKSNLEKVMETLQCRLLTHAEEERFRLSFTALHPTFLHRLRKSCPSITKGEELFCMLLVLNQTNEEVAYTLGISRPSVVKIRYRLRRKIACDPNETIEDWTRSLTSEEKTGKETINELC